MTGAGFSNDEKHRETLAMLQETLDYLRRLPPVPVTREMCRRIQDHLDQPTSRTLTKTADTWTATAYTAVGFPWLAAQLQGQTLNVRLLPRPKNVTLQKHIEIVLSGMSGTGADLWLKQEQFGAEKKTNHRGDQ